MDAKESLTQLTQIAIVHLSGLKRLLQLSLGGDFFHPHKKEQIRHREIDRTATSAPEELSEYEVAVMFWRFWAPLPLPGTVGCVRLMNTKSLIWIDRSPTERDKNIHFPTKFKSGDLSQEEVGVKEKWPKHFLD